MLGPQRNESGGAAGIQQSIAKSEIRAQVQTFPAAGSVTVSKLLTLPEL